MYIPDHLKDADDLIDSIEQLLKLRQIMSSEQGAANWVYNKYSLELDNFACKINTILTRFDDTKGPTP